MLPVFPPLAKCNLGSSIRGCSRVAGPFFSLPQHHPRLFKGCWSVLFTCPQQPSAAVWRRSKVQPWGAALHLGTNCNCLGAADGRPSFVEQMEICGKTYVPNIYIYIPVGQKVERPPMPRFKASFFGKVDAKVAYNINASVHNAYSILCPYKCRYSYIHVAFILYLSLPI